MLATAARQVQPSHHHSCACGAPCRSATRAACLRNPSYAFAVSLTPQQASPRSNTVPTEMITYVKFCFQS
eukprot:3996316-Amphidinium_carterae.1